jgi:hypothetical protein
VKQPLPKRILASIGRSGLIKNHDIYHSDSSTHQALVLFRVSKRGSGGGTRTHCTLHAARC